MLANAMKTCRVGNTGEALDTPSCFGAGSVYTDAEKQACSGSVKSVVAEDTGTTDWIKALPGCNPIQAGPGDATIQKNCPGVVTSLGDGGSGKVVASSATSKTTSQSSTSTSATTTKTSAAVSPSETSTSSDTGSGGPSSVTAADGSTWVAAGCYVDSVNPRTLSSNGWWGNPITNSECAKGCSKNGYSISGAENGGQCFCGNSLGNSAKVASSDCNSACAGDSSQKCGGPARLSVYKKSSSAKKARAHRHLERHRQAVS